MGILKRLFRKSHNDLTATDSQPNITLLQGDVDIGIVGESFCQDALWQIAGVRRSDPVRQAVIAVLVPEPDNPYDPNAIRIDVNGLQVGHLSRADALRYRGGVEAAMRRHGGPIALNAVIVGGGHGRENLGVWLQHDPADFGVVPTASSSPKRRRSEARPTMRTGFSEAWVTDEADDSYDLAWSAEIPDDDVLAIAKLRELLPADLDPIDRHFMFTELEERLYKLGLRDPSVLDEFDAACLAHHEEMHRVRSAFITKWDTVPLLNTYRQMCIRRAKEKDWESSRWWADQGIAMYGDKATRAEWVTDLESRRDRAIAKIEPANRATGDQAGQRRAAPQSAEQEPPASESLTCHSCGSTFERPRTRGRKPLMCPSCRA